MTDGIYSHARIPMYVGDLLIAGGLAVHLQLLDHRRHRDPVWRVHVSAIIAAQEQCLAQRFGDAFRAYCGCAAVAARLSGLGALHSCQFRWRRVLVKEYGTPVGWISVLSLITIYNIWDSAGGAATRVTLPCCAT